MIPSRLLALAASALLCAACSNTPAPMDMDTGDGGPPDMTVRFAVVNGCQMANYAANDYTHNFRTPDLIFSMDATPRQYSPNCVKIAAGGSVNWTGNFTFHPLVARGGDTPSPIDGTGVVKFPTPGVFGFVCSNHSSDMFGAVWVVP